MDILARMAQRLVQSMSKEDLERIINSAIERMLMVMTKEERIGFVQGMAERSMVKLLEALDRDDRAKLMNALLPQILKELPLDELDILGAHPAPEEET